MAEAGVRTGLEGSRVWNRIKSRFREECVTLSSSPGIEKKISKNLTKLNIDLSRIFTECDLEKISFFLELGMVQLG